MHTVLAYTSALEFWRSPLSDAGLSRATCRMRNLPEAAPSATSAKGIVLASAGALSAPLHVVALDGHRKATGDLVVHQSPELPSSSFRTIPVPIGAEAFVISPELLFVHLSSVLSLPRAVHLGCELCGTYAPDESQPFGVRGRTPLTTPAKLANYLDRAGGVRGMKSARKALPFVASGSASPRESTLCALLTLPYVQGGSNLTQPLMNAVVPLGKRASWTTESRFFRCDLLWKDKKVAVEYDSTLCHTGATRIAEDASRRNALESLGFTVVTATWKQVTDYREYNRFARILAGHLGRRIRPRCSEYPSRQFALRSELLR